MFDPNAKYQTLLLEEAIECTMRVIPSKSFLVSQSYMYAGGRLPTVGGSILLWHSATVLRRFFRHWQQTLLLDL